MQATIKVGKLTRKYLKTYKTVPNDDDYEKDQCLPLV